MRQVLEQWQGSVAAQADGQLSELTQLLVDGAGGGKLMRGSLVVLGHELAGGQAGRPIYQAAAAYEIIHTGFLIHDDIMDRSMLRRGRPTAHIAAGGGHYGQAQAICLGDAAYFLAHRLLAEAGFAPERTAAVLARFSQIALDTAAGQMLDLKLSRSGAARTEADVLRMYGLKTAAYTITGPLAVGALLAGASAAQLAAIAQYGEHVGLAFQIQDDILGVYGTAAATGKSVTSDIEENKNTVLIAYAERRASAAQLRVLARLYGRAGLSSAAATEIQQVFTATGALAYAQDLARSHAGQGRDFIPEITSDENCRLLLEGLSRYCLERKL